MPKKKPSALLNRLESVTWLDDWDAFPLHAEEVTVRKMIDAHTHLRQGARLPPLAEAQAPWCSHVLPMPNLKPPLTDGASVMAYAEEIEAATEVEVIPCLYLTDQTKESDIRHAASIGVMAAKLYPASVTTGSASGVTNIPGLWNVFEAMEACGMVLCLHGEVPDREQTVLSAEQMFVVRWIDKLSKAFPDLKIVLEHVTSKVAVETVEMGYPNLFASITVHHLFLVFQDVIGAYMYPDNFCKPVAKLPHDRAALVRAVLSGSKKFFLGTDSAPHEHGSKYAPACCAGVFTAPVAAELLVEFFARLNALDKLEGFTSGHAAEVYGLTPSQEVLRFTLDPHTVPSAWHGHTPFWAGKQLQYRLQT